MQGLNAIIHQPVRLRVMAALTALDAEAVVDFTYLRKLLDVTDGNLGAHLIKLEEAGYIGVTKTFEGRKPKTFIAATGKGRRAFEEYAEALRAVLG